MPAISSHAPGKAILFGEHAVVYGQPAIAVPVNQLKATTYILANPNGKPGEVSIEAPNIRMTEMLSDLDEGHPLKTAINETQKVLKIKHIPACKIRIVSTIPIASGLGSGAAIAISLIRAFSKFLGQDLLDSDVNAIAFEVDKYYHGNPSGIDNTVITYGQPIYFIKEIPFEIIKPYCPFNLVIADTGIKSSTREMVNGVRQRWSTDSRKYEDLFTEIGSITTVAKISIENGDYQKLGSLMSQNQEILRKIEVSHPALDHLIDMAEKSGALGAKLSGAGGGGNIIALTDEDHNEELITTLKKAGAQLVISTQVKERKG
jgi:mevalonate kinase